MTKQKKLYRRSCMWLQRVGDLSRSPYTLPARHSLYSGLYYCPNCHGELTHVYGRGYICERCNGIDY
jgi:hypothetical protein